MTTKPRGPDAIMRDLRMGTQVALFELRQEAADWIRDLQRENDRLRREVTHLLERSK